MPSRVVVGLLIAVLLVAPVRLATAQGTHRVPVRAEILDISDRPDFTSYTIARLIRGEEVTVVGEEPGGWLAIEPPPSVFLWIPEDSLDEGTGATASVIERNAITRVGRPGARRLGPESLILPRGAVVTLSDRAPLFIGKGRGRQVWLAIEPPLGFRAYVRAQGVDRPVVKRASTPALALADVPDATWQRLAGDLVRTGSPLPESRTDPTTRAQAMALESDHRAALSAPLTMWRLDRIRDGYRDLAGRTTDPTLRDALNRRVRLIQLQEESSAAARRFADQAQRSKGEDLRLLRSLGANEPAGRMAGTVREPYDATGLLMRSSRLVDGERVYALIGADGFPAAYLKLAPGIGGSRYAGAQVGVRGSRRYDETLRADVIEVNDLEPLSAAP